MTCPCAIPSRQHDRLLDRLRQRPADDGPRLALDHDVSWRVARRGKVAIPATPAGALYSEAVRLDKAGLAFIAGTTCTNLPKDAGVKAHTEAIFDLISQRLARLKLDFSDLVAVSGCRPLSGVAPYTLSDHSLADSDLPCQLQGGFCRRERGLHEGP